MNSPATVVNFEPRGGRRELAAPHSPPALLTVEGLTIADRQGRKLVRDVGFDVPLGGTIGIVGESGSGKSLTCRAVLGLLPAGLEVASGSIRYRNTDLLGLGERGWRKLRGVELSAVFQDPASYLNPSIPVGRQLTEALRSTLGLDKRAASERAFHLLRSVGLADAETVYRQYPFELSGGMAQRVLIAIAVSAGPQLLIADEATTALDATVQAEVLDLLDRLRRAQGLTLILVSHDLAVVSQVCDHVIVMRDGAIVEAGPAARVLGRPDHAYTRSLIDNHHRYGVEASGNPEERVAPLPGITPAPTPAPVPLLQIRNLRAAYGNRAVLDGIDLHVERGEILGVIGETGSGKTTILRSILGLVTPETGSINLEDQDLTLLRGKELRAFRRSAKVQYVFQDPLRSLDPDLPLGVSIGEGLDLTGRILPWQRDTRVIEALQAVGLDPALAGRLPRDLSGGQRQRTVLARALVLNPALLLMDEPVSALDSVNRIHVLQLMRQLAEERGIAQIFISHDLGSIAGVADRVAVLHQGQIVETGKAAAVLACPTHPYTRRLLESMPRLQDGHAAAPHLATFGIQEK